MLENIDLWTTAFGNDEFAKYERKAEGNRKIRFLSRKMTKLKEFEETMGIADVELKHYTRSGWSSLLQDKI